MEIINGYSYRIIKDKVIVRYCGEETEIITPPLKTYKGVQIDNYSSLFENTQITKVDLTKFDFTNIKNVIAMFKNSNIEEADFRQVNMGRVLNMAEMFYNCKNLKNVSFNKTIANTFSMASMFYNCNTIETITLERNIFRNLQTTESMFENCSIGIVDLYSFTFPKIKTMEKMFKGAFKLEKVKLPKTGDQLMNINQMFAKSKITEVSLKRLKGEYLEFLNQTFYECKKLNKVILPDNLRYKIDTACMFYETPNLKTILGELKILYLWGHCVFKYSSISYDLIDTGAEHYLAVFHNEE